MWRPEARVACVEHLSPAVLRRLGIRGLLLDLDETLLAGAHDEPEPDVRAWAERLRAAGVHLALVSNARRDRVRHVARILQVPGYALAGKPGPWAYRRAVRALGVPPEACAAVGDQLFTDVLGARLAGLRAVLVAPRSDGGLPHTRALRRVEALLLEGGARGRPHHRG